MSIEPLSDGSIQEQRFCGFLRWVVPLAWIFTAFYGVVYVFAPHILLAILFTSCMAFSSMLVWSRWLLAHGQFRRAVLVVCAALLGAAVICALAIPQASTMLVTEVLMAVALMLMFSDGALSRPLLWASVGTIVVVVLLSELVQLFPPLPAPFVTVLNIPAGIIIPTLIIWLLWQFAARQQATLGEIRRAHAALRVANESLEVQVAGRTAALQAALADVEVRATAQAQLLQELAQQRAVIRELSVPVLPIGQATLVMPLIGVLDSERLRQIQEAALRAIEQRQARRLLLDITGVPIVDSHVAQGLLAVVLAARLLGAQTVLVGIRPEVAQAIVGLGVDLSAITTLSDLQKALA